MCCRRSSPCLLVDNWVGDKEHVEEAVEDGQVKGDGHDDGFTGEELEGTGEELEGRVRSWRGRMKNIFSFWLNDRWSSSFSVVKRASFFFCRSLTARRERMVGAEV